VGYVSPDFRDHAQRLFTFPLLREHDHEAFEIVCYSSTNPEDAWTERLRSHADVWRNVAALSANDLAALIRDDQVDVLVDLSMHMDGQRLKVFAQKPAPVQLAWLAYPGTTGVDGIDYRVTDPYLDPPGAPLPYSEQSLWLPHSFWCYDPDNEESEVSDLPALAAGHITFGCLNNFLKVNPGVFELWAGLLTQLPTSKFLLLAPSGRARATARRAFEAHGVDPERVDFVGLQWRKDYLASYHRIDVALDCVPYNGHTTSLDAFWMGVPIVTLVGNTVAGRAGLCQAYNLKLPELVAESRADFVQKAVALTRDLPRLAELRKQLRSRMRQSPLMDAPRFARDLEALYRAAWRSWCGRESPAAG
jgi:protein O-GlcNAc transferase